MNAFLALGDSYTVGEGVPPNERWPVQLAGLLRLQGVETSEPRIIAQTGWTTDDLEAAIRGEVAGAPGRFDLVSLLIGVNDAFRGERVTTYASAFQRVLASAISLAAGRPGNVLVLSVPDWGVTPFARSRKDDAVRVAARIDTFNEANRRASRAARVRYVDITPLSREAAGDLALLAADGLHPSGDMYARWAQLVLGEARAALSAPGNR